MSSDTPAGDNRVTCRHCGTENGTAFTYCLRCLGHLPTGLVPHD
ncbi:DUF7577 domain-containing protein [Natrinema halophilum]|nr:hypothetical protein [Natrinema halophilum]